jgi:invasion protein IalB
VQRKEKLEKGEEARLRPMRLKFAKCTIVGGCVAKTDASPDLLGRLRNGAGLIVETVRPPNTPVAQLVTLAGFN